MNVCKTHSWSSVCGIVSHPPFRMNGMSTPADGARDVIKEEGGVRGLAVTVMRTREGLRPSSGTAR